MADNQNQQPLNPVHMQVALQEAQVLIQLQLSRAQQLAIELHEARQMNAVLSQQLAEAQSQSNGPESKLVDVQRTK